MLISPLLLGAIALSYAPAEKMQSAPRRKHLITNTVYYCDTILHNHALRIFTQAGEVTNAAVINQYLALHPFIAGVPRHEVRCAPTISTLHHDGSPVQWPRSL